MKNYSLSIQIWIIFAIITLAITLIISAVIPITLRGFFTNEIYSTIQSSQDLLLNRITIENFSHNSTIDDPLYDDIRIVKHFVIYSDNQIVLDSPVNFNFLSRVKDDISSQNDIRVRYSRSFSGKKLFYIITKSRGFSRDAYLISYMSDSYRNDLVKDLFNKLIMIMGFIIILSWIPALLLSNYLSKPLVDLEHRVEKLAEQDWRQPVDLNRKDEIGKLADSVEQLRVQLIRQDDAERAFLQNVSHELKTPVMVIRSFAQAIRDGIYPKGNLDSSIGVIDEEGERLENKIKNLLYFSKLNYMSNHELAIEEFPLDILIRDVIDRLTWYRKDINWKIDLENIYISGDKDQWRVIIENLIDNQIRYSDTQIIVNLFSDDQGISLEIQNDGPPIEDHIVDNLFTEYKKGHKGEFGLGLAIVARILKLHDSSISVSNEKDGVKFTIKI